MNIANLSGRKTSGLRLEAVTCDPPKVESAVWTDVHIRCKNKTSTLVRAVFRGCTFENCTFGNAALDLTGVVFEDCKFREVTFMYGRLRNAVFTGGELRDSYLRSADLRDGLFRKLLLRKVSFEKADLHGCRFEEVTLQKMDRWGWHGYAGAILPDEQRFEFYETNDPIARLRAALHGGRLPVPQERVLAFIEALEAAHVSSGPIMLLHNEWKKVLSLTEFAALGRFLTSDNEHTR